MTKCDNTRKRTPAQVASAKKARLTTAIFIERAINKHGTRYDYSQTHYVGALDKLTIICKEHGEFSIRPDRHFEGKGCQVCARHGRRKTVTQFILEARVVHGNRYGYDYVRYVNKRKNIIISCSEHGNFEMTPASHLRGSDCPKCVCTLKNTETFIAECTALHDGAFGYERLNYVNAKSKVVVTCHTHGDFSVKASHHVSGRGCPKCSFMNSGFNRSPFIRACSPNGGLGKLYVIKCQGNNEVFYKLGITSRCTISRFGGKSLMPYDFDGVFEVQDNAAFIYDLEKRLHFLLADKSYTPALPFGGFTECFTTIKPIEQLLKKLSNTEQLQLLA